jgi:hypothetical protein
MYKRASNTNEIPKVDHEAGFNIYELPFTDMTIDADIAHLKYHTYLLNHIHAKMRMQENHYLYIDTLRMNAAGGDWRMAGYFNGSNPNKIYFSPRIKIDHVDLDKLMLKFENFGQDHLVSENLHGNLSGKITGKIHVHRDMVPILDDSELHLNIDVRNGKLTNYAPITALSDYFHDKNLKEIRFDTLQNKLDLKNGLLTIPAMTINSTLGFLEISGKQHMNMNYEYYVRVPMKMVTSVAFSTLFGKRKEDVENSDQPDEIIYRDKNKNTKFINLKITGNAETYKITTGKDKPDKKNGD